jgi:hypothetical protein
MCCCLARDNPQIAAGEVDIEYRPPLGTFSSMGCVSSVRTSANQSVNLKFQPYMIIPPEGAARLVVTPTLDGSEFVGFVEALVGRIVGKVE